MPDHVHHVFTLYEEFSLARAMQRIKSVSAHEIGRKVWQRESFDRGMRSDEDNRKKCEYICQNPVRAGLAESVDDYKWIWRCWIEGENRGGGLASAQSSSSAACAKLPMTAGFIFQMSRAYSRMVRSEENLPILAMLRSDLRFQEARSR